MRILHLCPEIPERAGTGGGRREWELVCGLQDRGHEITVAAVVRADQQDAVDHLRARGIEVIAAVRPEPQWSEGLWAALHAPRTLWIAARHSFHRYQASVFAAELRAPLRAWFAAGGKPDVALLQHDWAVSEFARLLPPSIPNVAGFHHIALMHKRAAETTPTILGRAFQRREARKQRDDMRSLPSSTIAGSACSQVEAHAFTELSGLPCSVVPNGADVGALAGLPLAAGEPGNILFSGTLAYPPNADAAVWLATDVLPRVQSARPEATLTVVGRGAPPAVDALAAPDVLLTGFVPEIEPYLESAQVYAAGLLSGAGTKLKVVEALAAGRPLVATSVAAEGIEIEHGVHALIADGPDAFAGAVVRLLEDRDLAERLAAAGRALVAETLSWNHAVDVLDAQLREIVPRAAQR